MKFCPECGGKLPKPNAKFCPDCGVALSITKEVPATQPPAPAPVIVTRVMPTQTVAKPVNPPQPVANPIAPPQAVPKRRRSFISTLFTLLVIIVIIAFIWYFLMPFFATSKSILVTTYMEGPVANAAVSIYALNNDGTKGALLAGPVYTDKYGEAELNLSQPPPIMLFESTGGSYYEHPVGAGNGALTQVVLSGNYALQTVVPSTAEFVVITPFSNMAAALALKSIKKGVSPNNSVQFANNVVSQQYRIYSITQTFPVAAYDSTSIKAATRLQRNYGLLLAGLVQDARSLDVSTEELSQALAQDWSDGRVDGIADGRLITIPDNSGKQEVLGSAGLEGLQDGINNFIGSPSQATNLQQFPISLTPVCSDPNFYISTTTLPSWEDGSLGWFSLDAVGGNPPYSWAIKEGSSLPDGFTLDADGNLSGEGSLSPGSTGIIFPPFTVVVSDSSSPQQTCEAELRISVVEKSPQLTPIEITCTVGELCWKSLAPEVSGGSPPYYFVGYASDKGQYPLDLTLWPDGTIKGTPSTAGTYTIYACAVDLVGSEDCQDITITVDEPIPTCNNACPSGEEQNPAPDCSCYSLQKCSNTCPSGEEQKAAPDCSCYSPTQSCEPGHYSVYCGGTWRCCLNGWVCCGGSCSPPAFC